jgi:hypothetical protein
MPWDGQPGEPGCAYAAFRCFKGISPDRRTTRAAAGIVGASVGHTPRWAHRWDWRERAEQWDALRYRAEDAALLGRSGADDAWERVAAALNVAEDGS